MTVKKKLTIHVLLPRVVSLVYVSTHKLWSSLFVGWALRNRKKMSGTEWEYMKKWGVFKFVPFFQKQRKKSRNSSSSSSFFHSRVAASVTCYISPPLHTRVLFLDLNGEKMEINNVRVSVLTFFISKKWSERTTRKMGLRSTENFNGREPAWSENLENQKNRWG